ncbi:30S ribosomal protein S8 [Halonatronum saccharophilum]|uniref:30S ribosomal protein S8 n=1 Tax=Halonatronum saccharophilum TaxID=150060 RepID=UPI0004815091|nr:30S ribosomal protein S8 [Halonatronum saccharophilum]
MSMTDPIADMLTRVRNANSVIKKDVKIPASNIKEEIARVLKEAGYIKGYERVKSGPQGYLRLFLKYGDNNEKVITGIKRISKPGLRVYANKEEVPKVLGGLGIAILSTSNGVMTDKSARKAGIGGEVICYVW